MPWPCGSVAGPDAHEALLRRPLAVDPRDRAADEEADRRARDHVAQVVAVLLDAARARCRWRARTSGRRPSSRSGGSATPARLKAVEVCPEGNDSESLPSGRVALHRVLQDARVGAVDDHRLREVVAWPRGSAPAGAKRPATNSAPTTGTMAAPPAVAPVLPQVSQVPCRRSFVRVVEGRGRASWPPTPTANGSRFWPENTPTKLRPRFFGKAESVRRSSPSGACRRAGGCRTSSGRAGPSRGSGLLGPAGEGRTVRAIADRRDDRRPRASSPWPSCRRPPGGFES